MGRAVSVRPISLYMACLLLEKCPPAETVTNSAHVSIMIEKTGARGIQIRGYYRNKCCRPNKKGKYFAAFGAGLLVACWCPSTIVVAVVAVVLICLDWQ